MALCPGLIARSGSGAQSSLLGRSFPRSPFLLNTALLIMSTGITIKAMTRQMSQVRMERGSTLRAFPPSSTKRYCITRIDPMTMRKFLFLPICSNTFMCSVLALKPLKVIAIMKVANTADFTLLQSTSPKSR